MDAETRRIYQRNAYRQYKRRNPISKKFGQFDPVKKLYFYGLTGSGKEVWKDYESILAKKEKQKEWRRKYYEKCKSLPEVTLSVGDQHPDNPNLYVVYKRGNKVSFGNLEKLLDIEEKNRKLFQKRNARYKKLRKSMQRPLKRGDVHPDTKFIFWQYSYNNKEIWMSPSDFTLKHEKFKEQQKLRYKIRMRKKILGKQ